MNNHWIDIKKADLTKAVDVLLFDSISWEAVIGYYSPTRKMWISRHNPSEAIKPIGWFPIPPTPYAI